MYLWLVAGLVTIVFAAITLIKPNNTKAMYLLGLAFFCGLMFIVNKRRINNFKE